MPGSIHFLFLLLMLSLEACALGQAAHGPEQARHEGIRSPLDMARYRGRQGCVYGNCITGYGIYLYENGELYRGAFLDGMRSGYGEYFVNRIEGYEGYYRLDRREGQGIQFFRDGSLYSGLFEKGEPQGEGVLVFASGALFFGSFASGVMTGTLLEKERERACTLKEWRLLCDVGEGDAK